MINDLEKINKQKMAILSVCSPVDKELIDQYQPSKYEVKFQGGAFFTEERVCDYNDYDNVDDQISEYNHRYSELTVWYYAWKHITSDYIGVCHYRRKFDLSDDEIDALIEQNYDAIVGDECYCADSIKEDYLHYHYAYDWTVMMEIIKEQQPDAYDAIEEYFNGHFFYPACMYIYRKEIFRKASEFVFPILQEFCKRRPEKKDIYWRRDAGFLGERLLSFYFFSHREEMRYEEVHRKLLQTKQVNLHEELQTEEQILNKMKELFKNYNLYAVSEVVRHAENQKSEALAAAKIIVAICKGEISEGKDTLLDYLPFSDDFLKLYRFLVDAIDSINGFITSQDIMTMRKMKEIIDQKTSPVAIYRLMKYNQLMNERSIVIFESFFISNGLMDYAEYFMEKERHNYPNSVQVSYLAKMVDGMQ